MVLGKREAVRGGGTLDYPTGQLPIGLFLISTGLPCKQQDNQSKVHIVSGSLASARFHENKMDFCTRQFFYCLPNKNTNHLSLTCDIFDFICNVSCNRFSVQIILCSGIAIWSYWTAAMDPVAFTIAFFTAVRLSIRSVVAVCLCWWIHISSMRSSYDDIHIAMFVLRVCIKSPLDGYSQDARQENATEKYVADRHDCKII